VGCGGELRDVVQQSPERGDEVRRAEVPAPNGDNGFRRREVLRDPAKLQTASGGALDAGGDQLAPGGHHPGRRAAPWNADLEHAREIGERCRVQGVRLAPFPGDTGALEALE
jgi:hypothetical protein